MTAILAIGAVAQRAVQNAPTMTTLVPPRSHRTERNFTHPPEQTRSLFRYQRDDNHPGKLTRVWIVANHTATAPISPNLFGNFIEHLGGVVYGGLWAQILHNPNLEPTSDREAAPLGWERRGSVAWLLEGYRSLRSVRLRSVEEATAERAALQQHVFLPTHRTRRYRLTLFLRAPQGKATLALALTREEASAPFWQTTRTCESGDWRKETIKITLPAGALARGEGARFVITQTGGGAVDVDQVELFPEDNVSGTDPDVLARAKAWHIPLMRYPGGNFASGYHWQDGVGPREARPTRRNAAWGGVEPNHFGTDEFLAYCRRLGATPQLTVNAGDGTPEEAANWVRYCNADQFDTYGSLRAANGQVKPYNVKLWEIGNELYGDWQIGHTDARHNAERYVQFRDALLAADPTLQLIATGKGDEFTPVGRERNAVWNEMLLRAAVANGRPAPDYLSIHPLVPLPQNLRGVPYAQQYESALAQPTFLDRTLLPDLACRIAAIAGPDAPTRIAITEWGIIVGGDRWWESPNHDSLSGAIFNALTLNTMLRNSDWVTLANMTAFMHGGGIKKPNGVVIVDPQYWTQQLYADTNLQTPIETTTIGPGRDVPARGFLPAVADVPDVDVFAALSEDSNHLVVFAVNRELQAARPLSLDIAEFPVRSVAATLLTEPDPQARNTLENPNAVAPHPFRVPAWPASKARDWQITLPPHSLVVLTFARK